MLPTASGIGRAIACPASCALPGITQEIGDIFAQKGTDTHTFLFHYLGTNNREAALREIPSDSAARPMCEAIQLEDLPLGAGAFLEAAIAWSEEGGGRTLGQSVGRKYASLGAKPNEWCGTADYVGVDEKNNCVIVLDYKTGRGAGSAADSWQLKFLGLAFADAYCLPRAKVGHIYLRENEPPVLDLEELDEMELAAIQARLVRLQNTIWGMEGRTDLSVKEGYHCKYCPAFKACPAKTALVREMASSVDIAERLHALEPADAGKVIEKLLAYDEMSKRLWDELGRYSEHAAIPLPDGRWLKPMPGVAKDAIVDSREALLYLEEHYGTMVALEAAETTKGGIERSVGSYARRNKLPVKKTIDTVIGAMRDMKAIEKKNGEVKPRIVKE